MISFFLTANTTLLSLSLIISCFGKFLHLRRTSSLYVPKENSGSPQRDVIGRNLCTLGLFFIFCLLLFLLFLVLHKV